MSSQHRPTGTARNTNPSSSGAAIKMQESNKIAASLKNLTSKPPS